MLILKVLGKPALNSLEPGWKIWVWISYPMVSYSKALVYTVPRFLYVPRTRIRQALVNVEQAFSGTTSAPQAATGCGSPVGAPTEK